MDKQKQEQLDLLIDKYAVYSSDNVYSDIIVARENFVEFINGLTNIGIIIDSVDWWCNATDENKNKYGCPHGYGGPVTKVGWFSEMSHDFDETIVGNELFILIEKDFKSETLKALNDNVKKIIKNKKTITQADGTFLTFKDNPCLTPGFNLYVPNEWKNTNR